MVSTQGSQTSLFPKMLMLLTFTTAEGESLKVAVLQRFEVPSK